MPLWGYPAIGLGIISELIKKRLAFYLLVLAIALAACSSTADSPLPTPDLEATVGARVHATIAALITPTPMPVPTHIPIPTPALTSTPTPYPRSISVPTPNPWRFGWTAENPSTFEEIEAELEFYRGQSLTVASWGGAYQEAQRHAYFLPFQEKFGIQIVEDSPVEYAKVRAMVQTRNVTWDVVDANLRAIYQLGSDGYLEELTPAIHNRYIPDFPEAALNPWSGGGGVVYSTGLAYRKSAIDELWDGRKPEDWTAFWDTQAFPGRRWMGSRVQENIFFAQFARTPEILGTVEGRATIASLTPEQVDQSFEMVREIKPHINAWWTRGIECPFGLLNNEVDMCTAWNVPIRDAQLQPGGQDIHFCFECGHLIQADAFFIPKGSPVKTLAELFISWTGEPEINANISSYVPYGPLNLKVLPYLYERDVQDILANLPNSFDALPTAVFVYEKWLSDNLGSLKE